MAVVIETTLGDITVDLYLEQRPVTCLNFLKLCKMKYYNFNLFHSIRSGFIAQTGDPTGEGSGGQSIWGILEGPHKRFFSGEKMPKIRHTDAGLISMVCTDEMMVGSQFFITLAPDLDSLDGTHCVIGEVTEGHEVLMKLNEVICDESHRPYRDVRITHTVVLEDPFNDPPGLRAPSRSPSPNPERLKGGRIAPDEEIDETQGKSAAEVQEMIEEKEAKARATILEIVGDLPDAEIAPPENVLFVCKLNPVTTDEDLEIIFSRFGKIVSCEVIRDKKTGNSLQYAFIEFDNKKACEDAYFKMDNVLIDDRRIHVDFSQSVSKMRWLGKGRGVQYFDEESNKKSHHTDEIRERHRDKKNRRSDRDHYNNGKRYHDNDRNNRDKHHKHERNETYNRNHKDRSRSRSRLESSHDKDKYKESKDRNSNNKLHKHDREYKRNSNSNSHKRKLSPSRNNKIEKKNSANSKNNDVSNYKRKDDDQKLERYSCNSHKEDKNESRNRNSKHEQNKYKENKVEKYKQDVEPKTPSPVIESNKVTKIRSKTDAEVLQRKKIKKNNSKWKRNQSASSSNDSSGSSSSSETSSSSESDNKKKKLRRKKRKYSSSSSSSSSTTSSSSSSSSSSESSSDSSSSSDSGHRRKHKKKSKKTVRKSKKKL